MSCGAFRMMNQGDERSGEAPFSRPAAGPSPRRAEIRRRVRRARLGQQQVAHADDQIPEEIQGAALSLRCTTWPDLPRR